MTSRQNQAWFLLRYLRGQDLLVEAGDEHVEISAWSARKPREIDPEVLESIRCLKPELLLILRREQELVMAWADGRQTPPRRKKWKYQRRNK